MKRRDQLERDLVKCEDMRLHAEPFRQRPASPLEAEGGWDDISEGDKS
jgi:hypothetical protein